MKALTTYLILSFLIVLFVASSSVAQEAAAWSQVAPEGEAFTVMMPQNPSASPQTYHLGGITVSGTLYSVKSDNALYRIWSLNDQARTGNSSLTDEDAYLDACAELIWDAMLKAEREGTEKGRNKFGSVQYQRELQLGATPGREYSVTMDTTRGMVHFYNDRSRIYVLVVTSPVFVSAQNEQFLKSFTLANQKPAAIDAASALFPNDNPATTATAAPASVDYSRTFSAREVTQKARILSKPAPQYTEAARIFGVSGTVMLRAVFSATGEVTNIQVIHKLPHGLTDQSIRAVRGIHFQPAQKDGHPVSQYIQIEYNFNLH